MMKNIHITLTEFRNESRLIKEVVSLDSSDIFQEFVVIALGAEDLLAEECRKGSMRVVRLQLMSRKLPKIAPFQLLKFLEFMFLCLLMLRKEKPTVINVHTLALLPLGALSKFIFGSKLVYDAHELETEKNGIAGIRKKASKFIERKFIRLCDLVVVVGERIADWYCETYKIPRPVVVKNAPFIAARVKNNLFREKLSIREDQKILLYQGGVMRGRGIHLILEAFKNRGDDKIVAVFMGYGELEDEIRDAEKDSSNIFFFPAVKPDLVLEYTASADIGISFIERTCLSYYYCMPNKLFEYAMGGLPVLVSPMKEMAESVRLGGFGVVVSDATKEAINDAVDSILALDLDEMSRAAYRFACTNSWERQEKMMLEGYRRMLSK